ncbi:c-type cytochrome [Jiella avicenniae]|uniref:Cytochrome c family protein n=1 Tax=Jiella avicenniae TaxID=2907202 RepID=A0A9X1P5D3_9HYPH|nr:cytochrome c family protein [Jiella avicenniae]MCE7030736.1 cytochrome c family protein [Jiella avicenniae]
MDSFEANKIFGAILGTVFVLFGGSILAEGLFHSEAPEQPGYEIVAAEPSEGEAGAPAAAAEDPPIAALLQSADAGAGEAVFKKCTACHSGEKGGPNKVGPHLWDVVTRPIASVSDFSYSAGMQEFSEGGSANWDYDHLYHFLKDPKGVVSGTKMGFAGVKSPEDRANLIAYLHTLSDNPAPLPEAPAEGEAAAGGEEPPEVTNPATTTKMGEGGEEAQAPVEAGSAPESAPVESSEATTEAKMSAEGVQGEQPAPPAAAASDESQPAADGEENAAGGNAGQAAAPAEGGEQAAASSDAGAAAPAAGGATEVALAGDPAAGEKVFNKCRACHAVGEGAKNKIGPELNGILGEKIAAVEGYTFSSALQDYAKEHPTWTVEELHAWLADPKAVAPGTKMSFPGLKKPEDIDNVIAYLASFDENGAKKGE